MIAGKKYKYLRNDDEMMAGKAGQGGVAIFKTEQALIMGTYNQDMTTGMNMKEVGKMAVSAALPGLSEARSQAPVGCICICTRAPAPPVPPPLPDPPRTMPARVAPLQSAVSHC
jgi:hypothetical protein